MKQPRTKANGHSLKWGRNAGGRGLRAMGKKGQNRANRLFWDPFLSVKKIKKLIKKYGSKKDTRNHK